MTAQLNHFDANLFLHSFEMSTQDEDIRNFISNHASDNISTDDLAHVVAECFFIKYGEDAKRFTSECEQLILNHLQIPKIIKKVFTIASRRVYGQPCSNPSLRMYARRCLEMTEHNFHNVFDRFINKPTLLSGKDAGKKMKKLVVYTFINMFTDDVEMTFNESFDCEIDFDKIKDPFHPGGLYDFKRVTDDEWSVDIDVRTVHGTVGGSLDVLIYRNSMKYIIHVDVKDKGKNGRYPLIARLLHRPFTANEIKMMKRLTLDDSNYEAFMKYEDSDNDEIPDDELPRQFHGDTSDEDEYFLAPK